MTYRKNYDNSGYHILGHAKATFCVLFFHVAIYLVYGLQVKNQSDSWHAIEFHKKQLNTLRK